MRRILVLATLSVATCPAIAQAHAILVDSKPAIGASVPGTHVAFTLRYNSRIDRQRSRLTLTRPDHAISVLPIGAESPPDVLSSNATLAPGDYVIRWQVLAVDGHITRGDVPFTVTGP